MLLPVAIKTVAGRAAGCSQDAIAIGATDVEGVAHANRVHKFASCRGLFSHVTMTHAGLSFMKTRQPALVEVLTDWRAVAGGGSFVIYSK